MTFGTDSPVQQDQTTPDQHDHQDQPQPRQSTVFTRRRLLAGAAVAAGVAGATVVGVKAFGPDAGPGAPGLTGAGSVAGATVFSTAEVAPLVKALPVKTVKSLNAKRLGAGLLPPTNRWFSGLVFGDKAMPVFPLPLTFGLTDGGFSFGAPKIVTTEKNIAGGYVPDEAVDAGGTDATVVAYDQLSVTAAILDGDTELGRVLIAQGSPFVVYTATKDGTLTTKLSFSAEGDAYRAQAGQSTFGLVTKGDVSGTSVKLSKGQTITWFVVPTDGTLADLATLAADPVTGGGVDYSVAAREISTTLSYRTAAGGDTAYATMPHQQSGVQGAGATLGTYASIYGTLTLYRGTKLTWTSPAYDAVASLDVADLSAADKKELSTQVAADISAIPAFPADTYFGGKALYRVAMLWELADQLGVAEADVAKTKLVDTLTKWTQPKGANERDAFCFVWDDEAKGVVGLTPSFGSEEFNDHHFHYGYFLYAAGVLGLRDPSLVDTFAPVMNLLAADIGSSGPNDYFVTRRNFDAYASHGWASGTSPFADGNNQESSSEAVTAWTGLALWGDASKNAALSTEARWMLSSEAHAGHAYWTNFDLADPVYKGYGHKIVALNWGGKRDYATWFSPEPAAMLGILVIPMSPSSTYLAGDPDRIAANVTEAVGTKFDQKFGDYLLMYAALGGKKQAATALETARTLSDKTIDDGNSKSYLLAWLMVQAN
ncbi:MAG: glycosyl hydrolase [Propionibacteriaceae bacterium]